MNCEFKRKLPIPKKVKAMYPVTDKMREDFEERDVEIKKVLSAWEYLVMTWNLNNSIMNIDANIPMPDYVNMSNQ